MISCEPASIRTYRPGPAGAIWDFSGASFSRPLHEIPIQSGSPGLTDVHEEIFPCRPDAVKAGLSGDIPEFVSVCGERTPRGPGEILPRGGEKIHEYQVLGDASFFRVRTSAGTLRTCIFLWQLGQSATVFSITSNPPFESQSM